MARLADQFSGRDVLFWGIFALAIWGVAVLGAGLAAFLPHDWLGALHASRLESGSVAQLRTEVAELQSQAASLRQQNAVLLQRFALNEAANGAVTQRVGALELSVPKLVEALNGGTAAVDNSTVTGSTGNAPTTFEADGGSVSVLTSPLSPEAAPATVLPKSQPMPKPLAEATPNAAAFGIALGPPIDASEGAEAWQTLNAKVGTLLVGLTPVLAHLEGSAGRRVVAGPIATEADARELCGRMAKVGIACASVPFIGDPLPLPN